MSETKFGVRWYVLRENGPRHHPTYIHDNEQGARGEAKRLARSCPGERFIVLQAVAGYRLAELPIEEATYDDQFPDLEPPF